MIYLDHHATTPMDPRVLKTMLPYMKKYYGNPSSRTHKFGWDAEEAVNNAREQVAKLINSDPNNIIFTSGATESNNTVLKNPIIKRIITSTIEHSSISNVCYKLSNQKNIEYIGVDENGLVKINELYKTIKNEDTELVSIMMVNNEIGTIQDIHSIVEISKPNTLIHSDIAQAVGKINIDVKKLNINFASFSAHKIYGPKGIGAIYAKTPSLIEPLLYGGEQESGFRSGTLNVPAIVGFGKACEIAKNELELIRKKLIFNENYFLEQLTKRIKINHHNFNPRVCGSIHISLPCDVSNLLSIIGSKVAVSSTSACMSNKSSKVLKEVGFNDDEIKRSLRICVGKFNTLRELRRASKIIAKAVKLINEEML